MKSGAGALDLLQNVGGLCGPDEELGFFVVMVDVVEDGRDEFLDAEEDAALKKRENDDRWVGQFIKNLADGLSRLAITSRARAASPVGVRDAPTCKARSRAPSSA